MQLFSTYILCKQAVHISTMAIKATGLAIGFRTPLVKFLWKALTQYTPSSQTQPNSAYSLETPYANKFNNDWKYCFLETFHSISSKRIVF